MHYITLFIIILIVLFLFMAMSTLLIDISKFYPLFAMSSTIIGLFVLLRKEYNNNVQEKMENRKKLYDIVNNRTEYKDKLDAINKTGDKHVRPFLQPDFHYDSDYLQYRQHENRSINYYDKDPLIQDVYDSESKIYDFKTIDDRLLETVRTSDINKRNAMNSFLHKNNNNYFRLFYRDEFDMNDKRNWWEQD